MVARLLVSGESRHLTRIRTLNLSPCDRQASADIKERQPSERRLLNNSSGILGMANGIAIASIDRLKKNCFRFTLIESRFREIFRHTPVTDPAKGAGASVNAM